MKERYARTWIGSRGSTSGDKERKFSVGVDLRNVVGLTPFKDGPTVEYVQLVPVSGGAVVEAALANCREKQHDDLAALSEDIETLCKKRDELLKAETPAAREAQVLKGGPVPWRLPEMISSSWACSAHTGAIRKVNRC